MYILLFLLAEFFAVQYSLIITEIYYHRAFTHNSLWLNKKLSLYIQFHLWITTGISRWIWMFIHILHHALSDTARDPLSPTHHGKWKVFLFTPYYYFKGKKENTEALQKFMQNKEANWIDILQDKLPFISCGLTLFTLGSLLVGWWLLVFYIVHYVGYLLIYGFLSSFVHDGEEIDEITGRSENLPTWISLFTAGASNHKYHHLQPGEPDFSKGKNTDPAWWVIKLLIKLGLAKAKNGKIHNT